MTTAVQRLTTLAQAMGMDVKQIILTLGLLANLSTTDKSSFVAAINEVKMDTTAIRNEIGDITQLGTAASFSAPSSFNYVIPAGGGAYEQMNNTGMYGSSNNVSYYLYEGATYYGIVAYNTVTGLIADTFVLASSVGNSYASYWNGKVDVNGDPNTAAPYSWNQGFGFHNQWTRDNISYTAASSPYATIVDAIAAALDAGNMAANLIDDTATDGSTNKTWSADKIYDELLVAKNAVIQELTGIAPEMLDTFQEVAAKLGEDDNLIQQVIGGLANRVRFDEPQQLTQAQQLQVRQNTGAAAQSQVDALQTTVDGLGDLSGTDLLAVYNAAKA